MCLYAGNNSKNKKLTNGRKASEERDGKKIVNEKETDWKERETEKRQDGKREATELSV